jgi:protein-disulfide isomerase
MLYQTAKDIGLDVTKLKKDMTDDAIAKQVQGNIDLGTSIGVRGTPMFIIGEQVYPGALQNDQLKKAVDDARAAIKK